MADKPKYFVVRCDNGTVYGDGGLFDYGTPVAYRKLENAKTRAQQQANYYRVFVRVDDQEGNEVCRCKPEERRDYYYARTKAN